MVDVVIELEAEVVCDPGVGATVLGSVAAVSFGKVPTRDNVGGGVSFEVTFWGAWLGCGRHRPQLLSHSSAIHTGLTLHSF